MESRFLQHSAVEVAASGSGMTEGNDTGASTCASLSLEAYNRTAVPTSLEIFTRVFNTVYYSAASGLGIYLNCLVIYLVLKYRKLHTVHFAIAVQIAIADLLVGIGGFTTIISNLAGSFILGLEACIMSAFLSTLLVNARTALILSFALNCFISVFCPFSNSKCKRRIAAALGVSAWLFGLTMSLLTIPGLLDCYRFVSPTLFCTFSTRCSRTCKIFGLVYITAVVIPLLFIPMGLFLALYIKGRIIRKRESSVLGLPRKSFLASEWRALKTFGLQLLAIIVVTAGPILFLQTVRFLNTFVATTVTLIASWAAYLLIISDPIILLRNADVKEILKTQGGILCFKKKRVQ